MAVDIAGVAGASPMKEHRQDALWSTLGRYKSGGGSCKRSPDTGYRLNFRNARVITGGLTSRMDDRHVRRLVPCERGENTDVCGVTSLNGLAPR